MRSVPRVKHIAIQTSPRPVPRRPKLQAEVRAQAEAPCNTQQVSTVNFPSLSFDISTRLKPAFDAGAVGRCVAADGDAPRPRRWEGTARSTFNFLLARLKRRTSSWPVPPRQVGEALHFSPTLSRLGFAASRGMSARGACDCV